MHQDRQTSLEIAYWIPKHILLQGQRTLIDLGPMSASMQQVATSQDTIGWCEFMANKVSTNIASIQQTHCAAAPCMMNGDDWIRHFISHIIHITHFQWIFRNSTLHDRICGTL
jgi:hypothetical protein